MATELNPILFLGLWNPKFSPRTGGTFRKSVGAHEEQIATRVARTRLSEAKKIGSGPSEASGGRVKPQTVECHPPSF